MVHRDGYTDFKREVILVENQSVALVADLSASGALRILSTPEGAEVRLDGELVGKTPVSRDAVPSGDHIVEFKLAGYFDHKETMKVDGGREKVFSVDMKVDPDRADARAEVKRRQAMSSFGAKVNPVGGVTVDFGLGYPYYLQTRVMVGAVSTKFFGFRRGCPGPDDVRHHRLRAAWPGAAARGGAVLGAAPTRTSSGSAPASTAAAPCSATTGAVASLAFADIATVSAFGHFSWWADHFCPSQQQMANGTSEDAYCNETKEPVMYMQNFPNGNPTAADTGHRFYTGLAASAAVDRLTSPVLRDRVPALHGDLRFHPPKGVRGDVQPGPHRHSGSRRLFHRRRDAEVLN